MSCGAGTVDNNDDFVARFGVNSLKKLFRHNLSGFVSGLDLAASSAAFSVLSHADFHFIVCQSGDFLSGGGMSGSAHCNSQRRHVVVELVGNAADFVQIPAAFSRSAGNLRQRNAANQTAAIGNRSAQTGGNVFVRIDRTDVKSFVFRHFHSHVAAHDVASMVKNDQQRTGFPIHFFQSLENVRSARRGKNVASNGNVKHAVSDKTADCGFVSGSAHRNDGDLVGRLGVGTADQFLIYDDLVRERDLHAG